MKLLRSLKIFCVTGARSDEEQIVEHQHESRGNLQSLDQPEGNGDRRSVVSTIDISPLPRYILISGS